MTKAEYRIVSHIDLNYIFPPTGLRFPSCAAGLQFRVARGRNCFITKPVTQ